MTSVPDTLAEERFDDATIGSRAWCPVSRAATPDSAEATIRTDYAEAVANLEVQGLTVAATGEHEWLRPAPGAFTDSEGHTEWYEPCEPNDDGAEEFWVVQTLERKADR